ncbi:hypothetical protein OPT61_g5731 [Boeremia exigua]|uniref:Uncharacterized protein n=1 Tax=Boeremia exigua TaxID=749465 RepID=A0ACC2I9A5_9PLEO|nr:hypothetical protein OPT61_g5731 [Boeremia exigua]
MKLLIMILTCSSAMMPLASPVPWVPEWEHPKIEDMASYECALQTSGLNTSAVQMLGSNGIDSRGYRLRVSLSQVLACITRQVDEIVPHLSAIMEAFDPPLRIDEACRSAVDGGTPEQRSRGAAKHIGGVKVDWSLVRVEIL